MPDGLDCSPYIAAARARIFNVGDRVALQRDLPTTEHRDELGFYRFRAPATGVVVERPWIWRREISPVSDWNDVPVQFASGPMILVPPEFLKRVEPGA